MNERPCHLCRHVGRHGAGTQSDRKICTRPYHLRGGGFAHWKPSIVFERDSIPEAHRVDGDKCGPEGLHWEVEE